MLLATVVHETGHLLLVVLTGGRLITININLNALGDTLWISRKPRQKTRREYFVWAAGHTFAGFIGAYLVFSGFSILAVSLSSLLDRSKG